MTSFGELLRPYRVQAGLSQRALAKKAGVSRRTVEKLESSANVKAHVTTAGLLADALDLAGERRIEFIKAAVSGHATDEASEIVGQALPCIPPDGFSPGGDPELRRTLPRAPVAFTGRARELQALIDTAEEGARAGRPVLIHAIDGMAGVGKTALALQAAHKLASEFPDGQLFVRLHAHTPGRRPARPGDVLRDLLRETGMDPRQIPASVDEKERLWRDRLVGKHLLLLLDDADTSDQVEPLIPGVSGSVVLVTSRRRLTGLDGAVPLPLDVLSPEQAAHLFARLSGRGGSDLESTAELVRLSGFLPLAIRLLAARLRHSPTWTVSDLVDELTASRDRSAAIGTTDQPLSAVFDLSYSRLSSDRQRFFCYLGLHPGTEIDAYAAAALTGLGLRESRAQLDALFRDHLIEEPSRGRYRFHDLIGDYASTLAVSLREDKDEAIDRLLSYYLQTARQADEYLARHKHGAPAPAPASSLASGVPGPDISTREDATAWMHAERSNLHAAVEYAMVHGRPAYATSIPSAMNGFLRTYGQWEEAFGLHRIALEAARGMGADYAQADAWLDIATLQYTVGDHSAAKDSLAAALRLYDILDDYLGRANVLYYLGLAERLGGDTAAAIASLLRALEIYEAIGNVLGRANALTDLGYVRCLAHDFDTANTSLIAALRLYQDLGNENGQANALNYLGVVQQQIGDNAAAADSQQRSLSLYNQLGNQNGQANALNYLAHVQFDIGDYRLASANATQALERYQSIGNQIGAANALRFLGRVLLAAGDTSAALLKVTEALELHSSMNEHLGEANDYSTLGDIQFQRAEYAAAEASFTEALRHYQSVGDRNGEAEALNKTGEVLLASREPARALAHYNRALAIAREIPAAIEEERALGGIARCRLDCE
jgi:tetratricopeptide (TPR) repeat protein/transcriptional regulator with XRE-family HTH domain